MEKTSVQERIQEEELYVMLNYLVLKDNHTSSGIKTTLEVNRREILDKYKTMDEKYYKVLNGCERVVRYGFFKSRLDKMYEFSYNNFSINIRDEN